jgi:hypothetical protein
MQTFKLIIQALFAFSQSQNLVFKAYGLKDRSILVHKRLLVLNKFVEFHVKFLNSKNVLVKDLDKTLLQIRSKLLPLFHNRWSSFSHNDICSSDTCSKALVIVGNHKISRTKCYFSDVYLKKLKSSVLFKSDVFLLQGKVSLFSSLTDLKLIILFL